MATERLVLDVNGMHCSSCGMLVDEALEDLPGVTWAATSVRGGTTVVDHDPALTGTEALLAAITDLGYTAAPAEKG